MDKRGEDILWGDQIASVFFVSNAQKIRKKNTDVDMKSTK